MRPTRRGLSGCRILTFEAADEKSGTAAIVYKAGKSACGLAFGVNLYPEVSATTLGQRIFLLD